MLLRRILVTYFVALVVFLAIDAVWLGVIAVDLYQDQIGHLLHKPPNFVAAGAFYLCFVSGILVFGVRPGRPDRTLGGVVGMAALYGTYTYLTYELTNMATLERWPLKLVVIDVLWGAALSAAVAGVTFAVEKRMLGE